MNEYFLEGPIVACATSLANHAALAIIRFSSVESFSFLNPYFSIAPESLHHGHSKFVKIFIEEKLYDEGIITYYRGPKSYNGENIIELSLHGNTGHVEYFLEHLVSHTPCRMAMGGEFTYRALKNGKLTLSQVEGLDLFLNAAGRDILQHGKDMLFGSLKDCYDKLHRSFLELQASLDILLDFSEDVGFDQGKSLLKKNVEIFTSLIENLVSRTKIEADDLLTPHIALLGETNAGKSTFFNYLLGHKRSIVSETPGTTRDYLTADLVIHRTKYCLVDTAGLRENFTDPVEGEGMLLSRQQWKRAFFRILVIHYHQLINQKEEAWNLAAEKPDLVLVTHLDLATDIEKESLYEQYGEKIDDFVFVGLNFSSRKSGPIGPEVMHYDDKLQMVDIGEKNRGPIGPGDLITRVYQEQRRLQDWVFAKIRVKQECLWKKSPIIIERHRVILASIWKEHQQALENHIYDEDDLAIVDHHVKRIGGLLQELIGVVTPEHILKYVFENFCIGK
jgi:tRNA modification GTPase